MTARQVVRSSGSISLKVNEVCIDNKIYVLVKTFVPPTDTGDMKYASFVIEISKEEAVNVDDALSLEQKLKNKRDLKL